MARGWDIQSLSENITSSLYNTRLRLRHLLSLCISSLSKQNWKDIPRDLFSTQRHRKWLRFDHASRFGNGRLWSGGSKSTKASFSWRENQRMLVSFQKSNYEKSILDRHQTSLSSWRYKFWKNKLVYLKIKINFSIIGLQKLLG